ncbi:MAG TPA: DUF885 family protein [bacterium]
MTRAPHLSAALDAYLDWYYATYPVNATFIGMHDHDDRLPDLSPAGVAEGVAGLEALRGRLQLLPSEPMTASERLDRLLVEGALDIQAWELTSRDFYLANPSLHTGEAIFGVIALLLRPFAPLERRLKAATARMRAIPEFLAQARANVHHTPRAWAERARRECRGAIALLERGLGEFLAENDIRPAEHQSAAAAAAQAFRDFDAHLSSLPEGEAGEAACGSNALDLLVRRGHFLPMDAAGVLALGQHHLTLAEEELHERAASLGITDWRDGLARLQDVHPALEGYYARYTEVWEAARAAAQAHGLVTWPEYPIRFVPQPLWAREAAPDLYFLFYRAPAAFDRLPVVEYLVTAIEPDMPSEEQRRRLRATNESVIKLNHVVHHGSLGHHVQNWYAYHRAGSRLGRIAAVDCASRIALFAGGTMAEGWACYATDLIEEIGFLTPLEQLAHSHSRLRMAARAVADVNLHSGAWTLEETAAFYRDRAGLAAEAARAEAVKNSMHPGTALMYLCGTTQIHDLRREMQRRPGFDLRYFHDRLLSYGSIPVALIAAEMQARGPS